MPARALHGRELRHYPEGSAASHAPLLPFDGNDVTAGDHVPPDPLRLTTFVLRHVDVVRVDPTAVNVSGVLVLSIAGEGGCRRRDQAPRARWNYAIVSRMRNAEQKKLQHIL